MNNSAVVSKRSSFMIEDILRSTHDPQDETLTRECPSTQNAKENSSREASKYEILNMELNCSTNS